MDVLQLMKGQNNKLRNILGGLESATTAKAKRTLMTELDTSSKLHFYLEEQYLYPEVSGLYSESEELISSAQKRHRALKRQLSGLSTLLKGKPLPASSAIAKKLVALKTVYSRHLEVGEQDLMPRMRELIPTQEREDLGQVCMDVIEDGLPKSRQPRSR